MCIRLDPKLQFRSLGPPKPVTLLRQYSFWPVPILLEEVEIIKERLFERRDSEKPLLELDLLDQCSRTP
jgi:hypothetical protein